MKTDKIFKQYPRLTKYFKTSDGFSFFSENAAETHARNLDNKNVKTIERGEFVVIDDLGDDTNLAKKEAEEKAKQDAADLAKQDTTDPTKILLKDAKSVDTNTKNPTKNKANASKG
ncbi:hypothetical protein [Aquimarina algiphila]|uniref:hypothetical protein n=1 Tax=Aquimarina algiphila TaxID=2047982 RepID=UPI0023308116|nr:hypothetical protein [Aquimarina algiphila]